MYGKKICVTPLPYLNELPISSENSFILDFDLKNIKDIVERLKLLQSQNNSMPTKYVNKLEDNYEKYLYMNSQSHYKEMISSMKKIRVKVKFKDMKHNSITRHIGEEFVEESARAEDLIKRGFCVLVEDIKEKAIEVETAVKEVKKEKAVKEKAVRPATKETKKNVKK